MKRLFTFVLALIAIQVAFAQSKTFVFTDLQGNELADGATIEVTQTETDGAGTLMMRIPIAIKNVSGKTIGGRLRNTNPQDMPNGQLQVCAFEACSTSDEVSQGHACPSGYVNEDIMTEWKPKDATKVWTAKFKIEILQVQKNFLGFEDVTNKVIGDGPTLNVHFNLGGTTNINKVEKDGKATVKARYAVDGSRLSAPAKGINILKLSNGKTVKVLVK